MKVTSILVILAVCVSVAAAAAIPTEASSVTVGDIWKGCGTSKDEFRIGSVVISPDPPAIGKEVTVTVKGNLSRDITAGTVDAHLKLGIIPVHESVDICDVLTCPLKAGVISQSVQYKIPSYMLSGHVTGTAKVIDNTTNDEIACIMVDFELK